MNNGSGSIGNVAILFLWAGSGLLSWYLALYLFSHVLSPLLIEVVRKVNTLTHSLLARSIASMLYTNISNFISCFVFALLLSLITKSTQFRLALYVVGAVAVGLYINAGNLVYDMGRYPELPAWAMTSSAVEFFSLLFLLPIIAVAGSRLGTHLRLKGKHA